MAAPPTTLSPSDLVNKTLIVPNLQFMKRKVPTANKYRNRVAGEQVTEIILHGTESIGTQMQSLDALATSGEPQSAHYWIGRDHGLLYSIVAEDKRANHAGNLVLQNGVWTALKGVQSHNPNSIGIEMYQVDDKTQLNFTDWQYETVAMLVYDIRRRWGVTKDHVISHASVNYERGDPKSFDWDRFNRIVDRIAILASLLGSDYVLK
jgi:N-acetyl-anhydromuramyl-L-alanine amidase AmpD